MTTDTERRETALNEDRATVARAKENYADYDLPLLRVMVRQTQAKVGRMEGDLANGKAAQIFRHSGDLRESLLQVQWAASQARLVLEALETLVAEKEAAQ